MVVLTPTSYQPSQNCWKGVDVKEIQEGTESCESAEGHQSKKQNKTVDLYA